MKNIEFKFEDMIYNYNIESTMIYGGKINEPQLLLTDERMKELENYFKQDIRKKKLNNLFID